METSRYNGMDSNLHFCQCSMCNVVYMTDFGCLSALLVVSTTDRFRSFRMTCKFEMPTQAWSNLCIHFFSIFFVTASFVLDSQIISRVSADYIYDVFLSCNVPFHSLFFCTYSYAVRYAVSSRHLPLGMFQKEWDHG